jgi:hypothetical protein
MTIKSWAKQYAKKHKFSFIDFNANHCRISNEKKYVDFWANGSYRTVDGKYIKSYQNSYHEYIDTEDGFEIKDAIKNLKNTI